MPPRKEKVVIMTNSDAVKHLYVMLKEKFSNVLKDVDLKKVAQRFVKCGHYNMKKSLEKNFNEAVQFIATEID